MSIMRKHVKAVEEIKLNYHAAIIVIFHDVGVQWPVEIFYCKIIGLAPLPLGE